MKHPIGTVICLKTEQWRSTKKVWVTQYWKINGPLRENYWAGPGAKSYPVIRCTKTGKEFKNTNGFGSRWIDSLPDGPGSEDAPHDEYIVGVFNDAERVSTANKQRGIDKRRADYLHSRILHDAKELRKLAKKWPDHIKAFEDRVIE